MLFTRKFHPVGQGAFYSEKFECKTEKPFYVVYDCGATGSAERLHSLIKHAFKSKSLVKHVFLSHFDSDHVNGVPFLIKHCHVERVHIPMLFPAEKAYWELASLLHADGKMDEAVSLQLLEVNNAKSEIKKASWIETVEVQAVEQYSGGEIKSIGQDVPVKNKSISNDIVNDWVLVPYNYCRLGRESIFREALGEAFKILKITVSSVDDFVENPSIYLAMLTVVHGKRLLQQINKILKKMLKDANAGTPNSNSMLLYSGPRKDYDICLCYEGRRRRFPRICEITFHKTEDTAKLGCLYMGDFEANDDVAWNDAKHYYSQRGCLSKIGCIQIPHHGSRHNFNVDLINHARCFVASFGLLNRYHHPGMMVIKKICNREKVLFEVTQFTKCVGKLQLVDIRPVSVI